MDGSRSSDDKVFQAAGPDVECSLHHWCVDNNSNIYGYIFCCYSSVSVYLGMAFIGSSWRNWSAYFTNCIVIILSAEIFESRRLLYCNRGVLTDGVIAVCLCVWDLTWRTFFRVLGKSGCTAVFSVLGMLVSVSFRQVLSSEHCS